MWTSENRAKDDRDKLRYPSYVRTDVARDPDCQAEGGEHTPERERNQNTSQKPAA
jgi:hypothetical protein